MRLCNSSWRLVGNYVVKSHNSGFKIMLSLRSAPYIFKRKKEKKESRRNSGGFKMSQVFLKKYYPTIDEKMNRQYTVKS